MPPQWAMSPRVDDATPARQLLGSAVSRIRPPPQPGGDSTPPAPWKLKLSLPWSSRPHGAAGNRGRARARPCAPGGGGTVPREQGCHHRDGVPKKLPWGQGWCLPPHGARLIGTPWPMAKSQGPKGTPRGWRWRGRDTRRPPGGGGGHRGGFEAQPPSPAFPPLGFLPLWWERGRSRTGTSSATAPHRGPPPPGWPRTETPPRGTGGYRGGWGTPGDRSCPFGGCWRCSPIT